MNDEQTTYSYTYDSEGLEWKEGFPSNINTFEPNKIQCALTLLDQIIEKEEIIDENFRKEKSASSNVKDWEQSIGESWTLFHLKRLKDLFR